MLLPQALQAAAHICSGSVVSNRYTLSPMPDRFVACVPCQILKSIGSCTSLQRVCAHATRRHSILIFYNCAVATSSRVICAWRRATSRSRSRFSSPHTRLQEFERSAQCPLLSRGARKGDPCEQGCGSALHRIGYRSPAPAVRVLRQSCHR